MSLIYLRSTYTQNPASTFPLLLTKSIQQQGERLKNSFPRVCPVQTFLSFPCEKTKPTFIHCPYLLKSEAPLKNDNILHFSKLLLIAGSAASVLRNGGFSFECLLFRGRAAEMECAENEVSMCRIKGKRIYFTVQCPHQSTRRKTKTKKLDFLRIVINLGLPTDIHVYTANLGHLDGVV